MMKRALSYFIFLFMAADAAAQVTLNPTAPRMQETVRMQIAEGQLGTTNDIFDFRNTRITMSANRITVALVRSQQVTATQPSPRFDVALGQFPVGSYQVDVRVESPEGAVLRSVGSAFFSVANPGADDPVRNVTDLWWDPNESGWGLNLVHHPSGTVFATWFVYDGDTTPSWYVVSEGRWLNGNAYVGAVYRTSGPNFCYDGEVCPGPSFNPAAVTRTLVGEMNFTIDPSDYDRATVRITVNGRTVFRAVRRQGF
jgi:hypothetical protein